MYILVKNREGLPAARREYYASLAQFFVKQIGSKASTILEAGSGKGQLTFPLITSLPRKARLITVDSSKGSYKGSFEQFLSDLKERGLSDRVLCVKSDVGKTSEVEDASVDAVLSNELLCDLRDEAQLSRVLREFRRVLRPGGVMVHGEWSSHPANFSQRMTIKADSPAGTNTPGRFWNPDELFAVMGNVGFEQFSITYFDVTMRLEYLAALEELRNWGVRGSFLKQEDRLLRRYGIELPFEHIVKCRLPKRAA